MHNTARFHAVCFAIYVVLVFHCIVWCITEIPSELLANGKNGMCCSLCINHNVHTHTHSAHTPQHRLLQYFECNWSVSRSAWCICESMRTRHIRGTKNCRYGCKQSTTSYVCWLVGSTRIGMSAFQHTLTHTHLTSMWQRIAWKFHQKKCIEKPKPYHLCQYSTRQNTIAGHHLAITWPRTNIAHYTLSTGGVCGDGALCYGMCICLVRSFMLDDNWTWCLTVVEKRLSLFGN